MIPGHYLKRPEEWALDKIRVQKLKRERQLRDGTANRTVSTGMAPGTRQLLDDIRRLAREGHTPADISAQLDVTEAGVRNVLALGQGAYDQDAQGPIRIPELAAFQRTWGRSWPGGNHNGNGETGTENRRVLFEVEVLAGRTGGAASCATPRHGPCTRSAPGAATTAGTPASSTCPR